MTRRTARWLSIALATLLLATACNHPIEIVGEGDVVSASGTRDCLRADPAADATSCTDNLVIGEYGETYTAVPAEGWHFHRWVNYCTGYEPIDNELLPEPQGTGDGCRFDIPADVVSQAYGQTVPPLVAIFRPDVITGFDSFFMGHSFFAPFVGEMEFHGPNAMPDHTQQHFFSWNASGAPEALWNHNSKRGTIQGILDSGDVELFGMTYHPTYPSPEGYLNWIDYALEQNPDTRIFIAIPWNQRPGGTDATTYGATWRAAIDTDGHALIDLLRSEFPGADIALVPYGEAAVVLYEMFEAGELPDVASLTSGAGDGLFTDIKGHAGPILVELGSLVWLRALYGVDISTYDYDTGFETDLNALADAIVDGWDPAYNAPWLTADAP